MASRIPLLSNVKVAAPCSASWEDMSVVDGERVRFCQDCKLNVYNISEMTQAQAEGLLRAHEGRLCVRYYERNDGTIMTRNCPIGLQALRVRMVRQSVAAAALCLISALTYSGITSMHNTREVDDAVTIPKEVIMGTPAIPPEHTIKGLIIPTQSEHIMGGIVLPSEETSIRAKEEIPDTPHRVTMGKMPTLEKPHKAHQ